MDSKYLPLDLPVRESKDLGEGRVIYSFKKDEHAKLLLKNLSEMQANEGLLTDVEVCTTSKDYEEPFHSMLLAACSPVIKRSLTGKHFDCTAGILSLKGLTTDVLQGFRDFLYKGEFSSDEELVEALQRFANKYGIDSLGKMCEEHKDHRLSDEEMSAWLNRHSEDVLSQLHGMFQKTELATTLLEDGEGNKQFAVHGPLIAAASPVLREILSNDLVSQEGTKYRLKEVSSNILGDLIEYIYTGVVAFERENVEGLLKAACSYEIPALARACCDWLSLKLDSHNAVGILWLARNANCKYTNDLEEEAKGYIITNFASVCEEDEFDELEYEDLKEIIQHDDLCVECEEDVFNVVVKWVEADEDGRSPYMRVLLQCVRLEFTSLEFLHNLQQDHPLIEKCPQCLQIVQNAQEKLLAQIHVKQEPTDWGSFHGLEQAFSQSGDTPGFVPRYYDSEEDIKRTLEFLDAESILSDLKEVSPQRGPRKNGKPDMRFKENRRSLENKDGSPDMRVKINKERCQGKVAAPKGNKGDQDGRPLKKDGTPDKRFRVNKGKEATAQSSSQKPSKVSHGESEASSGPVKKDGSPDMRFKVNKKPSPVAKTPSSGSVASPVKRDGTLDMRYAVNKQSSGSLVASSQTSSRARSSYTSGPVKKDGTPDMRYAANKQSTSPSPSSSYGGSSLSQLSSYSSSSGPLKSDGTPDMRYAANKPSSSPLSSGYYSGGSSYSSGSSSSGRAYSASSSGPLKSNGTPDMRYAENRSSGSSPYSAGYSSGGGSSYSSRSSSGGGSYGSSSCGPLKSNGTPDMRFKSNRR